MNRIVLLREMDEFGCCRPIESCPLFQYLRAIEALIILIFWHFVVEVALKSAYPRLISIDEIDRRYVLCDLIWFGARGERNVRI